MMTTVAGWGWWWCWWQYKLGLEWRWNTLSILSPTPPKSLGPVTRGLRHMRHPAVGWMQDLQAASFKTERWWCPGPPGRSRGDADFLIKDVQQSKTLTSFIPISLGLKTNKRSKNTVAAPAATLAQGARRASTLPLPQFPQPPGAGKPLLRLGGRDNRLANRAKEKISALPRANPSPSSQRRWASNPQPLNNLVYFTITGHTVQHRPYAAFAEEKREIGRGAGRLLRPVLLGAPPRRRGPTYLVWRLWRWRPPCSCRWLPVRHSGQAGHPDPAPPVATRPRSAEGPRRRRPAASVAFTAPTYGNSPFSAPPSTVTPSSPWGPRFTVHSWTLLVQWFFFWITFDMMSYTPTTPAKKIMIKMRDRCPQQHKLPSPRWFMGETSPPQNNAAAGERNLAASPLHTLAHSSRLINKLSGFPREPRTGACELCLHSGASRSTFSARPCSLGPESTLRRLDYFFSFLSFLPLRNAVSPLCLPPGSPFLAGGQFLRVREALSGSCWEPWRRGSWWGGRNRREVPASPLSR